MNEINVMINQSTEKSVGLAISSEHIGQVLRPAVEVAECVGRNLCSQSRVLHYFVLATAGQRILQVA